jgi:hypothetical protein
MIFFDNMLRFANRLSGRVPLSARAEFPIQRIADSICS